MPSPIAHASFMIAIWPAVRSRLREPLPESRRRILGIAVLVALLGPDFDAAIGLVTGEGAGRYHNGITHSLFFGPVFGGVFAVICDRLVRCGRGRLFRLGTAAYVSHIVMDMFNARGDGVQLLWPLTDARMASPFPLFVGVIHSVNAPWTVHLVTILNELLFAAAVYVACALWRTRRRAVVFRDW